ncbi:hypothetical protein HPO96_01680 [Kribbella sandramycini]|uniref:Uncharacterized protein n=1 Tax=Kribbella sandramycini TaxID=60450 RepID=A0A7Y4NX09_9ACTN|nr:hypothetical protein [Kribbella sandramycini]MBB6568464.1 hypothetical protein [Kribbella sandramycini]NOL38946.1 hypothetical protein [Kribbella sandramycini]
MRSTLSLLAATGLLASGLVAAAPAAQAAPAALPTCYPAMPAKLVMNNRQTHYTVTYGQGCPATLYNADWKGTQPGDPVNIHVEFLDGAKQAKFTLYSEISPVGVVNFKGEGDDGSGEDAQGNPVATLGAFNRMNKYASAVDLVVTKSRGVTTATLTAGNYRPAINKFVRWAGKPVVLQYKQAGTSQWKQLAKLTTNAKGQVSYKWAPKTTIHYRAYSAGNSVVWDDYSPVVSR